MSTLDLVNYYVRLLILQYTGKPKAEGHITGLITPVLMPQTSVQVLSFAAVPDGGDFTLAYGEEEITVAWDDTAADIQTALRLIDGLETITVTGSYALGFTVTFTGVIPVAQLLVASDNTLEESTDSVAITITETDETLPLAVQNGFNLTGSVAVGAQLDVLGKYAGVERTGPGFYQQITLDDADFFTLIQMAIIRNSSGSSLATIQAFVAEFFPGAILVFDYQNMRMSYLISTDVGSEDLIQLFITQEMLPRPMTVQVALIIYAPVITTFFGFRTYEQAGINNSPFNTYDVYEEDRPWLSYANAIYA